WQPEGDRLTQIPLHTIEKFLAHTTWPIIIREVGQGFGPRSLAALLDLPLAALDLAGWGGTNFTSLEARRAGRADFGLAQVGHTCEMMVQQICARPLGQVKNFILSGGQANLAAAFVLHQQLATIGASSVVALAYPLLAAAQHSADRLQNVVQDWLHAWAAAQNYLRWRPHA
ncbi:MAG: hypothetical protein J6Y94_02375, partial [Bacteriovoracaceae bacterium]|nr:hypothetical protein [Bacteriovoracaceae bacterium]